MASHRTVLTGLGLGILLGACASERGDGPGSPEYAFPAGLSVRLAQALAIPPGEASVRLQYGRPVARNAVQETDPYCIFEVDALADAPRSLAPEAFRVTGIQRRVETFSGMPVGAWPAFGFGLGRYGGPSQVYYLTEFRLRSDTGSGARSLTCQHNQAAAGIGIPRHLTLAEMRTAVGGYFALELPH